ncbi:hypothetical protein WDZ16_03395 [Pseudokineococcus marinus]|uniref:Uncharacterized protein n=1 Tax=Pseudokineococcus marinus TaxID=351215 RepID=A0A849C1H8_9ACTN|nr:hypothetical protein [Pseudokineococcus marinus]NNH23548.1 hypothetical protein [Pseudokineococcus marinus]
MTTAPGAGPPDDHDGPGDDGLDGPGDDGLDGPGDDGLEGPGDDGLEGLGDDGPGTLGRVPSASGAGSPPEHPASTAAATRRTARRTTAARAAGALDLTRDLRRVGGDGRAVTGDERTAARQRSGPP